MEKLFATRIVDISFTIFCYTFIWFEHRWYYYNCVIRFLFLLTMNLELLSTTILARTTNSCTEHRRGRTHSPHALMCVTFIIQTDSKARIKLFGSAYTLTHTLAYFFSELVRWRLSDQASVNAKCILTDDLAVLTDLTTIHSTTCESADVCVCVCM